MRYCEVPAINDVPGSPKPCTGHLGKFDDCLAEGLWEWSLADATDRAGSADFEGYVSLVAVTAAEPIDVEGQGDRRVMVLPGNYLIWESSTGNVTVTTVDTIEGAREVLDVAAERWAAWDAGCDPDRPELHQQRGEFDECQLIAH